MSEIKVFYIWQGQRDEETNKNFIEKAIIAAKEIVEKDLVVDIKIEKDKGNKRGSPALAETILDNICQNDIVIADLTVIGETNNIGKKLEKKPFAAIANFNVGYELGFFEGLFAKNGLDRDEQARVIFVMNLRYKRPEEQLAFDIRHRDAACCYELDPDASKEEVEIQFQKLVNSLVEQLKFSIPYVAAQKSLKVEIPKPDKLFPVNKPFTSINFQEFYTVPREKCPLYWPEPPLAYLLIKPLKDLPSKFDFINLKRDLEKLPEDQEIFSPLGQRPQERNDFQLLNEGLLVLNNPRQYGDNKRLNLLQKNGWIWGIDGSIVNKQTEIVRLNFLRSLLIQYLAQYLKFATTYLKIHGLVDLYVGIMGVEGISAEVTNLKDQGGSEKYGKFRPSNEDGIFRAYPSSNILQNPDPEYFEKAFEKIIEDFMEPFYKEVLIAADLEHVIGMSGY